MLFIFSGSALIQAQPIAQWNFTGTLAGVASGYNSVNSITIGSAIDDVAYHNSSEFYAEGGWPSGALSSNAYMQFRMAPLPGYQLNITSIVLRMRRSQTGIPIGSGPTRWALRSNQDNYSTDIAAGTLTTAYQNFTINTASAFMGLTGNVSFRLYGYQQTTSFLGSNRLVIDDISVFGPGSALPVKLTSFSGSIGNNNIHLKWTAADISKGTLFSVERSNNGNRFEEVYKISEQENVVSKEYLFKDINSIITPTIYRIRITEPSGAVHYSTVVNLSPPNQYTDKINFIHTSSGELRASACLFENGLYQCSLYSMNGTLVYKTNLFLNKGENVIALPVPHLTPGSYILSIGQPNKLLSKTFIK